jgi:hypothetical protein
MLWYYITHYFLLTKMEQRHVIITHWKTWGTLTDNKNLRGFSEGLAEFQTPYQMPPAPLSVAPWHCIQCTYED